MDPEEALIAIRDICRKLDRSTQPNLSFETRVELGYELVEQFEALDEWIGSGGFLPSDWHNRRRTHGSRSR